MKKNNYFWAVCLLFGLMVVSCSDNADLIPSNVIDSSKINNPINHFVWRGMNSWYNWQPDASNLANTKDDNLSEYYTFLNEYSDPADLFYDLCYKHKNIVGNENAIDRFSWFIEDYVIQNEQFQGVSTSFGFRLSGVYLNDNDAILYVRYVAPNSPASIAGIQRGDIIQGINGGDLNQDNYNSQVGNFSNETITLTFASESGGVLTSIGDKAITAARISEDPVFLKKVFNDINGKKVGYLVYNSFRSSYNDELNTAFSFFKAEGINELVLDLRLNGGGSVLTSAYLASMIYANAGTDKFAELKYNGKHTNQSGSAYFDNMLNIYDTDGVNTGDEPINRLNTLDKLYVLTSGSTASASEMIINGLKPFITVKVVGSTTYGKNVGSITLYDTASSDYTSKPPEGSTAHKNAMQPIVFQIYNKLGESDYIHGFGPDIDVVEGHFWNAILPFGDENEVVLKAALDDIRGLSAKSERSSKYKDAKVFDVTQLENKFEKEMYIDDDFMNK